MLLSKRILELSEHLMASTRKPKKRIVEKKKNKPSKASVNDLEKGAISLGRPDNPSNLPRVTDILPNEVTGTLNIKAITPAYDPRIIKTGTSYYKQEIEFDGVDFSDYEDREHPIPINIARRARSDSIYSSKLDRDDKVKVSCECRDFFFTWNYYNHNRADALLGKVALYRRKTDTYPERNPGKVPGLCKHLVKLFDQIEKGGALSR